MKDHGIRSIWIILSSILLLLFSCASIKEKQTELGDPNAYIDRGVAHARIYKYDQAISDFTEALKINPRFALAYYSRATIYEKIGKFDQAISDLTKAVEINPRFAEAYYARGYIYLRTFKYDQAISDFTKTLEIYPGFFEAFYNRGNAYLQTYKFDQAIHDLNKALEINPNSADTYNIRGIVYSRTYQFDLAISDYTKALEINPNFDGAFYNRGIAHYAKKEYGRSLEDFNKAQALGYPVPSWIFDDLRKAWPFGDLRDSQLRYSPLKIPSGSRPKLGAGFGFWFSGVRDDYSIQAILEDGPAARAGLKIGDTILKINNTDVTPLNRGTVHRVSAGEKWTFKVLQDGIEKEIELVAEEPK